MGKKDRNRLQPKKNNHTPNEDVMAKANSHDEEYSAKRRKS